MGVAGAGKTSVGRALSLELGWRFIDADDRHSPLSVEKMSKGIPLTDADRLPWLNDLHGEIVRTLDCGESLVLSCSALKVAYRQILCGTRASVGFVYLKASETELRRRLSARFDHFAPESLLKSQLTTLEEPSRDEAVIVDARLTEEDIVTTIRRAFEV